jgi:hypothetical protein
MKFETCGVEVIKVSYEVDFSANPRIAVITPVLEIHALENCIMIACLRVDGHELLPTDRVTLLPGSNLINLKYVKIVNPIRHLPEDAEDEHTYLMSLDLTPDGKIFKTFESKLAII